MEYIMILDTETTSLDKPFCYDVSWIIMEKITGKIADMRCNVVEQVWHNLPLFESAYYKDKRQKYVEMMRKHDAVMDKWGYIMRKMAQDIRKYSISEVYAYNSNFDDKVISYNCDWFKCNNPLESIPIYDIWGYASQFITCKDEYKAFCEEGYYFTETENYSGSAENVYRFICDNGAFTEEHMGLFDSIIESEILYYCIYNGAEWGKAYTVNRVLPREHRTPFTIKINDQIIYKGEYLKKIVRNDVYKFKTE
jgi:hypothetical protein